MLLAACDGTIERAHLRPDSGLSPLPQLDAGAVRLDAAPLPPAVHDAGSPYPDAGPMLPVLYDSGTPTLDSGAPPPDVGPVRPNPPSPIAADHSTAAPETTDGIDIGERNGDDTTGATANGS